MNQWGLYSSITGWESVEAELDKTAEKALAKLDTEIATGERIATAASRAFDAVCRVMKRPEYSVFGAYDSEPREHLGYLIEKHLRHAVSINRFGDIS